MALGTPINKTSGGNATTSASDTTASFTPTANALVFAISCVARASNVPTTIAISSTHTGLVGSWTEITIRNSGGTGKISLFYILAGASPSSGTITFTYSGASNPTRKSWTVDEVTGAYGVVESNTGESIATTLSIALAGILAGNKAYGAVMSIGATGITEGTNETEIHEETSTGTAQARCQTEYGTELTVDWSGLSATVGNVGVALEIGAIVDITVSASVQSATFSIPSYTPSVSVSISPSAQSATFTIPSYTVSATQSITISPAVQSATFSIPTYTPSISVSISVATQSMTFSIPSRFTYVKNPPTHSLDLEASSSQYASIADGSQTGLDLTGDFTLETWATIESLPSASQYNQLIAKEDFSTGANRAYGFGIEESGGSYYIACRINGTAVTNVLANLLLNKFYHFAMTRKSSDGTVKFFVDGLEIASLTGPTGALNNSPADFAIGCRFNGATPLDFWDGKIKEVRVWNVIRTPTEIYQNAGLQLVGNESGLKAYYKLNNDYTDSSQNGNTLTASGSPVFSTTFPWQNPTAIEGSTNLETSLVSFYPLNEASGTREDVKGNNDLTDNNTVASASGILSNGGDFERGNSEYLSIADGSQSGLDITSDFSVSLWYKPEENPSSVPIEHTLVSKFGGTTQKSYLFRYGNDSGGSNRLILIVSSNGSSTSSGQVTVDLGTGTFKHVVMAYNASTGIVSFFVDGKRVGTASGLATSLFNSSTAFRIGAYGDNSDVPIYFADGIIDEVAVYARTLDYGDVVDLYNLGLAISYAGPNVTVSPAVQSATFSIPTYTPSVAVSVSPSVQSLTFSIPAYEASVTIIVTPSAQSATFTIPAYTVITPDAYVTPAVQAMTFSIPVMTVTAIENATASPSTQVLTFSTPEYSVTTTRSVTISIGINSLLFSIPVYRVIADFWEDKYDLPNTSYSDKYTPPSTSWSDKHSTPVTSWNDKY